MRRAAELLRAVVAVRRAMARELWRAVGVALWAAVGLHRRLHVVAHLLA